MANKAVPLAPPERAALTRLALSYALGRGSICLVSRSWMLQLYQPELHRDYAFYQWQRLREFLPYCKEPKRFVRPSTKGKDAEEALAGGAEWRLRVSSLHLEVSFRLLYPQGSKGGARLTTDVLSLVGAEAMASLWADRGRLLRPKRGTLVTGLLALNRYDWGSAEAIRQWIESITGAAAQLGPNPRNRRHPALHFDHTQITRFIGMIRDTWHANAGCLSRKFALPAADELRELILADRLRDFSPVNEATIERDVTLPQLRIRERTVRAPRATASLVEVYPAAAHVLQPTHHAALASAAVDAEPGLQRLESNGGRPADHPGG